MQNLNQSVDSGNLVNPNSPKPEVSAEKVNRVESTGKDFLVNENVAINKEKPF